MTGTILSLITTFPQCICPFILSKLTLLNIYLRLLGAKIIFLSQLTTSSNECKLFCMSVSHLRVFYCPCSSSYSPKTEVLEYFFLKMSSISPRIILPNYTNSLVISLQLGRCNTRPPRAV